MSTDAGAASTPGPALAEWTDYRPVSAMFIDLEGSVALLSSLGPEAYNDALRAFHGLVTMQVRLHDGEVVQYLGDGVLCFFHHGRDGMDRASAAVSAGVEILAALQSGQGPQCGGVRIGIASGLALFNYEGTAAGARVIGTCINLAARLQAEAEPGTILTCDESRHSAAAHFHFRALPARPLKGFAEDVGIWQVLERRPVARRGLRAVGASGLPFVGRGPELAALSAALAGVRAGQAWSVAILGEAGLGKTRLVQEFLAAAQDGCPQLVLRCTREEAGLDFHPIRSYLRWIGGVVPGDNDQARAAKLGRLFGNVWGLDAAQVSDLLLLLGTHPDREARPTGNPVMLRRWLRDQLIARLIEIRARHPALVLVVEDAHWLDPSTAEFLAAAAPRLGAERILLVMTQRVSGPEEAPVQETDRVIRLGPLSSPQSTRMIRAALGTRQSDETAVAWVQDKARGVPLFLSAFADFARRQDGLAGLGDAGLPLDLLDVFEQSLGRLPGPTRRFAQAAAVMMGGNFDPALVAALFHEDAATTDGHIALLVREKLVGGAGGGLTFAHDLIREAIYAGLGSDIRRRLHGAFADLVAARGAGAPAHILALHYERAERIPEAIAQYHAASLAAVRVGALQEAKDYLNRAFGLIGRLATHEERLLQELELRSTEGPLQMILGGPGNKVFGVAQRRSMELMAELGLRRDRTHLLYNSGLHDWARLRLAAADIRARDILSMPEGGAEAQLAGNTLAGLVAWHCGDNARADRHLRAAIGLYRAEDHAGLFGKYLKDLGVFSLFYAGLTAAVRGDVTTAREFAARAQQTSEALDIPHAMGFGLLAQFMTALLCDDPGAVLHHAAAARALAHTHGFPEFEAMAIFAQGWVQCRDGASHAKGVATMARGLQGWQGTDFLAWQSFFEAELIVELVRAGRLAEAQGHLGSLKRRLALSCEDQFLAPALLAEERLLAACHQPHEAADCLARAVAHAKGCGAGLWLARARSPYPAQGTSAA